MLDIGKYYFMTKVKGSSFKKEGFFEVQPIQLEQLYTVADHKLLLSLAERSGGQVFDIANIDQLVSKINNKCSIKIARVICVPKKFFICIFQNIIPLRKKIKRGTVIDTNAPVVKISQFSPRDPSNSFNFAVKIISLGT